MAQVAGPFAFRLDRPWRDRPSDIQRWHYHRAYCPIIRYHPAIVAQAAATVALLSDNRFSLAIGAGERLNEHVTGARRPSISERHAMLAEAIDIFRLLWSEGPRNYRGEHFVIDHAELFDLSEKAIPVILGVSGSESMELARKKADGIMTTTPDSKLAKGFEKGPRYLEVALAYAASERAGRELAHERFRFSVFDWSVNSELPTVEGFEAATHSVRPKDLAETIPAGPDSELHLKTIKKAIGAGFDHIVLTGIGPDQAGFTQFFAEELKPELK